MPFLGKDWRSDGDLWVKTDRGWETLKNWRVKIHENINHTVLQRLLRQSIQQPEKSDELIECTQRSLYIHIPNIKPYGANHGRSEVLFSQAVSTLDMAGAFKDIRRCNYVYKIMEILIVERITKISGGVQIQLFSLLQNALSSACTSHTNKKRLIKMLESLLYSLKNQGYSFQHVGGDQLWKKHCQDAANLLDKAKNISIPQRPDDGGMTLPELPHDVLRHIMLYLCSQEDLINSGKASHQMELVVNDNSLWREMCVSHFTRQQINAFIQQQRKRLSVTSDDCKDINWYSVYSYLYKRFGETEVYSDCVCYCSRCSVLFWKLTDHPCKGGDRASGQKTQTEEILPGQFIDMFNM